MKLCTSNNGKRIALVLIPFKAFVVLVAPVYFLFRIFYPHPLRTYIGNNTTITDSLADQLLGVFALCGPVLLVGAFSQFFVSDTKAGVRTLCFAVAPCLVFAFALFLWVISHLL
jgi:hypothetical protein